LAVAARLSTPTESLADSDLIVVSDLHMSLGIDSSTGRVDAHEQFRADTAFVGFLDHLSARSEGERRLLRLVILGDFLDFLHARSATARRGGLRLDTSEAASSPSLTGLRVDTAP
jgi:hypothetical protein